jgi:hypothetical protein
MTRSTTTPGAVADWLHRIVAAWPCRAGVSSSRRPGGSDDAVHAIGHHGVWMRLGARGGTMMVEVVVPVTASVTLRVAMGGQSVGAGRHRWATTRARRPLAACRSRAAPIGALDGRVRSIIARHQGTANRGREPYIRQQRLTCAGYRCGRPDACVQRQPRCLSDSSAYHHCVDEDADCTLSPASTTRCSPRPVGPWCAC